MDEDVLLKNNPNDLNSHKQAVLTSNPLKALGSYEYNPQELIVKEEDLRSNKADEEEEDLPDYMRVKEIFSFENIARMHREIEQLKDVVRELRGIHMP